MIHPAAPAYSLAKTGKKFVNELTGAENKNPGPKYNLTGLGVRHKSVSHSIGKSNRIDVNYKTEETPGPSHYNPQKNTISIEHAFTRGNHPHKIDENPGAGSYKSNDMVCHPKAQNYTMGSKCFNTDDMGTPGPGSYISCHQQAQNSTAQYKKTKFGGASRFSLSKISQPGPGNYQITSKKGLINDKGTIGFGERNPLNKMQTPAPNSYSKKSFVTDALQKKIGKSMLQKFKGCFQESEITKNSFIKYDIGNKTTGNSYSIGKQIKGAINNKQWVPAPTDYQYANYRNKNSFRPTLAVSKPPIFNDSVFKPGPSTYQTNKTQHKIEYTIPKSKSTSVINTNPGVGRYAVEKNIYASRGSKIGQSKRTNFIEKNQVGVGDYNLIKNQIGKITIPKAQRFQQNNKQPGPGDYHIQSTLCNYASYRKKNSISTCDK